MELSSLFSGVGAGASGAATGASTVFAGVFAFGMAFGFAVVFFGWSFLSVYFHGILPCGPDAVESFLVVFNAVVLEKIGVSSSSSSSSNTS